MVSRPPHSVHHGADARQGNGTPAQSKGALKETPKDTNGQDTSRPLGHEGSTPSSAQDVAELKDYVSLSARPLQISIETFFLTHKAATGGLSWKRSFRLSLQSTEHGHRGDGSCKASEACRLAEK